jgi:GNAT superfamily N-acetyltransferase
MVSRGGVDVRPVRTRAERNRFVGLPWRIYAGDANWVPPLIRDAKRFISPKHNPFFKHAEIEHFLAFRNGEVVGRVAAIQNELHNRFHTDRVGFFGLFECMDDPDAAHALLDTARRWIGERGLDTLRGPMNYSTNDTCGLLIDGFDGPPFVMMPYNPPNYPTLIEGAGFRKAKDLVAYHMTGDQVPDRLLRWVEKAASRVDASVRKLDMRRWKREVEIVRQIYNNAWEKNWGFVPFTTDEFDHMAAAMKPALDPHLVGILEVSGEPVGFALALPDVNLALRRANGRLFPFGLVRILLASRRIRRLRVPILGLLPEYRGRGLDTLLYLHIFRNGLRRGYREAEFSWILEDNLPMRRPLERLGATVHRTYRIYDRPVS